MKIVVRREKPHRHRTAISSVRLIGGAEGLAEIIVAGSRTLTCCRPIA